MKKGVVTTIEIADAHVKLVQAKMVNNVSLVTKCVVQPRADNSDAQLLEVLKKVVLPKEIDPEWLTVLLPRRLVLLRQLSLPSHAAEEIQRMVGLQLVNQVPYSREQIIFDYFIIAKEPSGYAKVLVAVVQREPVQRLMHLLNQAGVYPQKISLNSLGLVEWFNVLRTRRPIFVQEPLVLLDVSQGSYEICFCENKKLLFSRGINTGNLNWSDAQVDFLLEQIGLTLGAYKKEHWGADFKQILIVSNRKVPEALSQKLTSYYQVPLTELSCLDDLPCEKNVDLSHLQKFGDVSIAACLGFAFTSQPPAFNLLPQEVLHKKVSRLRQRIVLQFALSAAAVLILLAGAFGSGVYHNAAYLKGLEARLKEIKPQVEQAQRKIQFLKFVQDKMHNQVLAVDLFNELYKIMPDGITLSSLQLDPQGNLFIQGMSQSGSGVSLFQNSLVNSPLFAEVTLQYATKRRRFQEEYTDFKLTCRVAPSERTAQ